MDVLTKMLAAQRGVNFCALSVERQADYLRAVAQQGAADALAAIDLGDEGAAADIRDIRDLLRALRVMKRTAWMTVAATVGRITGWAVFLVIAALFMNGKSVRDIIHFMGP